MPGEWLIGVVDGHGVRPGAGDVQSPVQVGDPSHPSALRIEGGTKFDGRFRSAIFLYSKNRNKSSNKRLLRNNLVYITIFKQEQLLDNSTKYYEKFYSTIQATEIMHSIILIHSIVRIYSSELKHSIVPDTYIFSIYITYTISL